MTVVAIVGGGAAGMMAAATLAERNLDYEIVLIERNDCLGMKVMISGGGRCNVTTGIKDIKDVLKCYPRGYSFLKKAMYDFSPKDVFEWIENHGVELKIEKDMRVFPKSDSGKDIMEMFEKILKAGRVKILYNTTVLQIAKAGDKFEINLKESDSIVADKVILTAGGQAYRRTGSKGDGYDFAENLGHTITKLAPSLSSYMVEEAWIKELSGVSFEKVKLKLGKHIFNGPMLFTHRGVSGPAVFALNSMAAFEVIDKDNTMKLHLDFCPDFTYDQLLKMLTDGISENPKKNIVNLNPLPIPRSLFGKFLAILNINKNANEVSKKEINRIVELCKNCEISLIGTTPGDEFVTAGGVNLSEINPQTMESMICDNLYFAGEILDVDGFTGGYNLQAAWCTGRLAGLSV